MITQEQVNRFQFQQTDKGKEVLGILNWMKNDICKKLHIPPSEIKTGELYPLVNGNTGKIDKFVEN